MRSSHRKSRNGCRECKQRHKKCDESSPICLNCSITNRSCSFRHTRPSYRLPGPKTTALLPTPLSSPVPSLMQCDAPEWQSQVYSLRHLELLRHFESRAFEDASLLPLAPSARRVIMQCALTTPYLMDQILALSAAHLSTIRRGQHQVFQNQAIELQTRALTIFNRTEMEISRKNSPAWFLYASFLGLQVMFETFQCQNFDSFLSQLSTYFPVHQGVHAVARESWPTIREIVEEIVEMRTFEYSELGDGWHQECASLNFLIEECDLEEMDRGACSEAVELVQRIFRFHRLHPKPHNQIPYTISWPILVSPRFADLLRRGVPEALVILSFYAVLLHRLQKFWIFGNSGQWLIRSISAYLGTTWAKWLEWPNQELLEANMTMDS